MSTARFVTTSVLRAGAVWFGGTIKAGTLFTSLTITWKLLVALKLGEPLSNTRTVTVFVLGPCASLGVHVMAPPEDTAKPVGPDTRPNVSVLGGTSESVAVAVTLSVVCSAIV